MGVEYYIKVYKPRNSVLVSYVIDAGEVEEAWEVVYAWRRGELSYEEALRRLRKLARKHYKRKSL